MDDDLFIIPSDNILLGEADGVFVGGDQDLLSESESIVGPAGPPGPAGRDGRDGVDGQSATVTVGETTTTAPGTDAIVTNVGDNLNAVLNFSIPRGAVGETGPAGADGVDGVDGSDGFSPIATVTQTEYGASISITDSRGTTTAQVVNGSAGTPGQAATVTVGSTTTGNPGTNASVTNSGTTSAAVLDFTIPRGDTGPAGQDGRDGVDGSAATIAVGTTTTGNPGTNASVTNSGTSSAAVLDFVIPKGDTGASGPAGADGQAATITVGSTTTGAAGTNASVTNSGTSSAAVLNFTIPRGDTGTVDVSTTKVTTTALWTGNIYSAGSYADLSEAMQPGQVYIITVKGLSGTYIMEFPFTMRYSALQFDYYDGSTVARWRLNINANRDRITIDTGSMNMGTNTAILRVDKVILTQ